MIIGLDDILPKIYEKYPEITEKSLEKICKKGLRGINRVMREGDELFVDGHPAGDEYKFFNPLSPEHHDEYIKYRYFKHKYKKEEKDGTNK